MWKMWRKQGQNVGPWRQTCDQIFGHGAKWTDCDADADTLADWYEMGRDQDGFKWWCYNSFPKFPWKTCNQIKGVEYCRTDSEVYAIEYGLANPGPPVQWENDMSKPGMESEPFFDDVYGPEARVLGQGPDQSTVCCNQPCTCPPQP